MKDLSDFARQLRRESTIPEQKLWRILRNRKLCNCKFRRQVQIGNYIVDFISFEKKIVIELDGSEHLTPEAIQYDPKRTGFLNENGFKVIRYYNSDVMNNIETVLEHLRNVLQE